MRLVIAVLWITLIAAEARGQFVQVLFKNEANEKSYSKYLIKVGASNVIIGEAKLEDGGFYVKDGQLGFMTGSRNNQKVTNALWVADPGKPGVCPYVDSKSGERDENKKAKFGLVRIVGDDIQAVRTLDRNRTLLGIAADYDRALDDIAAIQKVRDAAKKTERAWFDEHGRMLAKMDQLSMWLSGLGYITRSKEIQKEIEKQRKTAGKAAANEREKAALASIQPISSPAKLDDIAAKVSGGKAKFKVAQSKHVRFVYWDQLQDAEITAALELAERVIEGFMREFVDPYVDDDFKNHVPDGLFQEFYYGPDDPAIHEKMLTDYYGHEWGRNKADEMKAEGAEFYPKEGAAYLAYRKVVKEIDIPGYTIHTVGHALMDLHYNAGARNDAQDWLREAVGYYVSLNYIGRNGLVCFSSDEAAYAAANQKVGLKTPQNGIADVMNQVAIKIGPPIEQLSVKRLFQINDADFAKAWSFFDWLAKKRGKAGHVWLRKTCALASDPSKSFAKDWRTLTEEFQGVTSKEDAFAAVEKEWREYAERDQIARVGAPKK